MPGWAEWVARECRAVAGAGQWRSIPEVHAEPAFDQLVAPYHPQSIKPGRSGLVSFASNDYLGLSQHPAVVAGAHAALDRWGAGAGAARLVAGALPVHAELEAALAEWKREPAALLFPTGYAANLGVLGTFAGAGVRVLSDERNHASIVDGCRLSRAEVCVYRHGDVDHVESLLRTSPGRAVVVSDAVFSMDGDVAPVDALAERCRAHGALLVLDEAHAVLGPDRDLVGVDHLRIGTLSKYLGSLGGFVAGPQSFVDLVVNRARPFIFTTAPSPADAGAALAALGVLCSGEGDRLVAALRANVDLVEPGHPSPIVPVVVGDERAALRASAALRERGLLVPAIRPPTVAVGTSRLRISVSAAHTGDQIAALLAGLDAVRDAP